ncbi:MAG: hypothetical protein ACK5WM_14220, partial [Rhodospirillales bacterium]
MVASAPTNISMTSGAQCQTSDAISATIAQPRHDTGALEALRRFAVQAEVAGCASPLLHHLPDLDLGE